MAARVVDLSSSGARLAGVRLPVGSELEVSFVPPGRPYAVTMHCVVVRATNEAGSSVGVTFSEGSLSFSVELTPRRTARPN
jgi:acyl-coenzyme A thioesterase PaaI-like protein